MRISLSVILLVGVMAGLVSLVALNAAFSTGYEVPVAIGMLTGVVSLIALWVVARALRSRATRVAIAAGIALVAISVAASLPRLLLFLNPAVDRYRYILPDGFSGRLHVTFGVASAQSLLVQGGMRPIQVDGSGAAETADLFIPGDARDKYVFRGSGGNAAVVARAVCPGPHPGTMVSEAFVGAFNDYRTYCLANFYACVCPGSAAHGRRVAP